MRGGILVSESRRGRNRGGHVAALSSTNAAGRAADDPSDLLSI